MQAALLIVPAFMALITLSTAAAQERVGSKAGVVQYADGEFFVDDKIVQLPEGSYLQMESGNRLYTKRGHLELRLAPNIYLRMGEYGLLQMKHNLLSDTQIALENGSALVEVVHKTKNRVRVFLSSGIVEIGDAGLYRIESDSRKVCVYGGSILVANGKQKIKVKEGWMANLNSKKLAVVKFDPIIADALHQWAARRSFDIFAGNLTTRSQMNWKPTSLGWFWNFDYRMRFYSQPLYVAWIQDLDKRKVKPDLWLLNLTWQTNGTPGSR